MHHAIRYMHECVWSVYPDAPAARGRPGGCGGLGGRGCPGRCGGLGGRGCPVVPRSAGATTTLDPLTTSGDPAATSCALIAVSMAGELTMEGSMLVSVVAIGVDPVATVNVTTVLDASFGACATRVMATLEAGVPMRAATAAANAVFAGAPNSVGFTPARVAVACAIHDGGMAGVDAGVGLGVGDAIGDGGEDATVGGGEDAMVGGGEGATVGGGEDATVGGGEDSMAGGGDDATVGGGEDSMAGGGEDATVGGG